MNIIKRIAQLLKPIEQPEPTERALMFDQVAQQLMEWTYAEIKALLQSLGYDFEEIETSEAAIKAYAGRLLGR